MDKGRTAYRHCLLPRRVRADSSYNRSGYAVGLMVSVGIDQNGVIRRGRSETVPAGVSETFPYVQISREFRHNHLKCDSTA